MDTMTETVSGRPSPHPKRSAAIEWRWTGLRISPPTALMTGRGSARAWPCTKTTEFTCGTWMTTGTSGTTPARTTTPRPTSMTITRTSFPYQTRGPSTRARPKVGGPMVMWWPRAASTRRRRRRRRRSRRRSLLPNLLILRRRRRLHRCRRRRRRRRCLPMLRATHRRLLSPPSLHLRSRRLGPHQHRRRSPP